MPRVALMTWFQYHNYGSALQVSALVHLIEELGYQIDVVNYNAHGKVVTIPNKNPFIKLFRDTLKSFKCSIINQPYVNKKREHLFDNYLAESITLTRRCETMADLEALNEEYDIFVCGSDQIWAPNVFNPHYFLDFVSNNKLKVAYAPSIGLAEIHDVEIARKMTTLLSRINHLSTRESSGSKIVSKLVDRNIATVLDPTLLVSPEEWRIVAQSSKIPTEDNYLLAYMLGNNASQWRNIYKIASKLKLRVRIIPVFQKDLKRNGCITEPVGPREFVSLVKNASYICTDSFHGVCFSINFGKDFCAFERFKKNDSINQNSRIYNILEKVGLEKRLIKNGMSIDAFVNPISWDDPFMRLKKERNASMQWLEGVLQSESFTESQKRHVLNNRSLCCGCSACAAVCPVGAINIILDNDGFWRAQVNEDTCISCEKCKNVCPFIERKTSKPIDIGELHSYKSFSSETLLSSSSGGAAADIAHLFSENNAAIFGCVFNRNTHRANHRLIKPGDIDGLASLAGSKYMQSKTQPALSEALAYEGSLAVFGTPCQIAAARNLMAKRDDVTYIDLICHGVPTDSLYRRYLEWLGRKYNLDSKRTRTEFRYKPYGWRAIHIYSTDDKHNACLYQRKDPYFQLFEAGHCYAKCCYECPWRTTSAADIRLGDYWGPKFERDKTGVSMVLSMTDHGHNVIEKISASGKLSLEPFSDYLSYQQIQNEPEPVFRERLLDQLANPYVEIENIEYEFAEPFARQRDLYKAVTPIVSFLKRFKGSN